MWREAPYSVIPELLSHDNIFTVSFNEYNTLYPGEIDMILWWLRTIIEVTIKKNKMGITGDVKRDKRYKKMIWGLKGGRYHFNG